MEKRTSDKTCVIIGASHAGANCVMELRKQGWQGRIILIDADAHIPYHRPPLSKAYLSMDDGADFNPLFDKERYREEDITLKLGHTVTSVDSGSRSIILDDGTSISYDALVLATGASALIPPIEGLSACDKVRVLRNAADAKAIQSDFKAAKNKRVVVIGGGYIGLETAASLKKMGGDVRVLEREERILARVAPRELAQFFQKLHTENGVRIHTGVSVRKVRETSEGITVICTDGSTYKADFILVGTGVRPNVFLAEQMGADLENGIKVNDQLQTAVEGVWAIGDVAQFYHPRYKKWMRLESVQNAVDQAKVVASNITGSPKVYDALPWFWSDQFHVKLQMVGLSAGYTDLVVRTETDREDCFSIWYFKNNELLAVDAVNNGKAFVLGTKFVKNKTLVDKKKLGDSTIPFKPNVLMKKESNVD
ncbi:NAD(P)/FAD-dependent oxidoreductase [Pseudozobellia thermophila]|uniref:3-phenylpropionate/trans-cinnamate dioxygenase ferredoxin reductase subunit n=1 Tax=Pseudozobellia thermophila TaxID=192903 RepID=A0A1M6GH73_9FLAO|nr:FAD-dependent oxidoreductase [Pseudozobellia thermophila]SHJ09325.1 3-phenylpropionate/trans-cinnamate dioxygenase ferredoxin reductase subunit [Pseudozobellia thermophila]